MRRVALGIIAVLFLVAAVVRTWQIGLPAVQESMFTSICLRVGLVLGAAWLAYDQLQQLAERVPPWLIAGIGLAMLLLVVHPKSFRLLLPMVAIVVALQFIGRFLQPARKREIPGRIPEK